METCYNYASHTPSPYPRNAGACPILNETCNGCNPGCPFYRTEEEVTADHARWKKRMNSLSPENQVYYAEKYYGGEAPWNRELEIKIAEARKNVSAS